MSYLVLARKYRPSTFSEVVGQKVVVRTLQNALAKNRIPHGLIFSGIRGTGKTTLARIFAKALNCEKGPISEPCGSCPSCLAISKGNSVDLHEIDGASNRGIQEIRDLKDQIRFMPVSARFKIIIIDEVHMLTNEAFNALLKTLEEPPEHVYFIFATTELHKVPVTILSRCQRYELKRVGFEDLKAHFLYLAEQENIKVESDAITMIAREAGGSVRDGLSLLDQVFSYCGDTLTVKDVSEVLGLVGSEIIGDIGLALLEGDLALVMEKLESVYLYGLNIKRFSLDLLSWFRNLVFFRLHKGGAEHFDLSAEEAEKLQQVAGMFSLETISGVFRILLDGLEKVNYASQPRMVLEMALIQAASQGEVKPVAELVSRLDAALAGLSFKDVFPDYEKSEVVKPETEKSKGVVADSTDATDGEGVKKKSESPEEIVPLPVNKGEVEVVEPPEDILNMVSGKGAEEVIEPPEEVILPPVNKDEEEIAESSEKIAQLSADKGVEEVAESAARQEEAAFDHAQNYRSHWDEFVYSIAKERAYIKAKLKDVAEVEFAGNSLLLRYKKDKNPFTNAEQSELLDLLKDFFGVSFSLKVETEDISLIADSDKDDIKKRKEALASEELVAIALDVFNGDIDEIRLFKK